MTNNNLRRISILSFIVLFFVFNSNIVSTDALTLNPSNSILPSNDSNPPDNPLSSWVYNTGDRVRSVAISSDGNNIVASNDYGGKSIYLFDKLDPIPLWSYNTGTFGDVWEVAISADSNYIAAISHNKKVYLFDKLNSSPIWEYFNINNFWSVTISSNGQYIAAVSGNSILLFNKSSSTPLWTFSLNNGAHSSNSPLMAIIL